jgi:hypothetical protein
MEQPPPDQVAKTLAFAQGLRKSISTSGRRWAQWPRGANDLATVIACIDAIAQRVRAAATGGEAEAVVAASFAELRAVLEWSTYQSAAIATARALVMARKTRAFVERFGLLDDLSTTLSTLVDSETSLIENVQTKNGYMTALAERYPNLGLPQPLVDAQSLAPKPERKPGMLDLITQLRKSAKKK